MAPDTDQFSNLRFILLIFVLLLIFIYIPALFVLWGGPSSFLKGEPIGVYWKIEGLGEELATLKKQNNELIELKQDMEWEIAFLNDMLKEQNKK